MPEYSAMRHPLRQARKRQMHFERLSHRWCGTSGNRPLPGLRQAWRRCPGREQKRRPLRQPVFPPREVFPYNWTAPDKISGRVRRSAESHKNHDKYIHCLCPVRSIPDQRRKLLLKRIRPYVWDSRILRGSLMP